MLAPNSETLFCEKCNKTYPIRDGIVDFLDGKTLEKTKSVNCEYHDKEANFYDNIHLHMSVENRLFRKIVSRVESTGKTILDIGTGTGFVLDNFEREADFVCLDISFRMLQRVIAKHPDKVIAALREDAECLPIGDCSVDIVTTSSTLHHLPNPERCLMEIYRVLKHEGRLIVFHEPNLKLSNSFFYNGIEKIFNKISRLIVTPEKDNRTEKIKEYAKIIFELEEEMSFKKMQEFNRITNVHKGFGPFDLLSPNYFKRIKVRTYYSTQTAYHNFMSLLFPKTGELFYITAVKK